MKWRLLDDNESVTEYFAYDNETETSYINHVYKDQAAVVDLNKAEQGKDAGKELDGEMHLVARIPPVIIHQWVMEGLDIFNKDHAAALWKKLDDPEWRYLRVNTGSIGRKSVHF